MLWKYLVAHALPRHDYQLFYFNYQRIVLPIIKLNQLFYLSNFPDSFIRWRWILSIDSDIDFRLFDASYIVQFADLYYYLFLVLEYIVTHPFIWMLPKQHGVHVEFLSFICRRWYDCQIVKAGRFWGCVWSGPGALSGSGAPRTMAEWATTRQRSTFSS